jgi:HAE1 family hydrophobic/amphiphilic exporter-1
MSDDLSISVLTDQSIYIADAISEVGWAAVWGGPLAVLVLYFFLRDSWATSIIAVTIPISVIATFLPMFKAGVSLNVMSLGGLALGIGMLVDNSIVVLEAIDRYKRKGLPRGEAAARGGREVAGAVTAATLTTVSVFLPIIFVGGVAGQLFYDLAVTVCLSLIASLIVSLTLIPTLEAVEFEATRTIPTSSVLRYALGRSDAPSGRPSVRILGLEFGTVGRTRGFWSILLTVPTIVLRLPWRVVLLLLAGVLYAIRWGLLGGLKLAGAVWWAIAWAFHTLTLPLARALDRLGNAYPRGLAGALRRRRIILPGAFLLFGLFLAGAPLLGTNLVPDLSQGEFAFRLRLSEGTTLESAAEVVGQIEDALLDDLRFERVFSVIGNLPSTASGRQTVGENLAQINFVLRDELAETEAEAIRRVREVLSLFPSVEAELARPSVLTMRAPVAIEIYSESLEALDTAAAVVAETLDRVEGIRDVTTSSEPGHPEISIEFDR